MSELFQFLAIAALETEKLLTNCYLFIRSNHPLDFILFYLLFFYLLAKVFKKKEKILTYKIIDESEEESICKLIKKKNQELIESLENFKNNNENNKTTHHSKRLENAYNEVASIEKLYTEFQEEILDSHKSIIDSLRMPIMKG